MPDEELYIEMPEDIANMKLPEPELVTYYKNLNNRTMWINDEIGAGTLEIARNIIAWNAQDKGIPVDERKPIILLLITPGGVTTAEHCVCDAIEASVTPVITVNVGLAASAGASIYLCGHKRYTFKSAQFLLHNGYASLSGTADAVISGADSYKTEIKKYADFIAKHSNVKAATAEKKLKGDWWLDVDDAVKIGIVDKVIETLDEIGEP